MTENRMQRSKFSPTKQFPLLSFYKFPNGSWLAWQIITQFWQIVHKIMFCILLTTFYGILINMTNDQRVCWIRGPNSDGYEEYNLMVLQSHVIQQKSTAKALFRTKSSYLSCLFHLLLVVLCAPLTDNDHAITCSLILPFWPILGLPFHTQFAQLTVSSLLVSCWA
jgi:hypothetical protein